ncbi:MAG: N-acetylglucosamine-6-phosphate deacetylase [Bdellovibrio sp.]
MKIEANIVTPHEIFFGEIEFDQNIKSINKISPIKSEHLWIYPGAIDLHIHGGGGSDFMQDEDHVRNVLRTHLKRGTTSLLATTVTEENPHLKKSFEIFAKVQQSQEKNEARLVGAHLEGPFIDKNKLGAQPDKTRGFDFEEVCLLHQIFPIKVITIAPESGVTLEYVKQMMKMGMIVQLGHTNAEYEEVLPFLKAGVKSFTHLYNAMSGLHHRKPGVVGAALAHAQFSEIIPDLLHVHEGAIKVAMRSIPHIYFVTDATAATGAQDGQYQLGPLQVTKCQNGVRLPDGTLAGSCLSMGQALENGIKIGLKPDEVAQKISSIPARLIGLDDCGEISIGLRSDFIVTNSEGQLYSVYFNGKKQ